MKQLLALIIITLISCGSSLEDTTINRITQDTICANSRFFGEIEICLPEIDGMTESYSYSQVKKRSDLFSYNNNTVLGLYLSKQNFSKLDNFENEGLDDYFKVYALNMLEGIEIGESKFKELEDLSKGNYIQKNWEDIEETILSGNTDLSLGRPVQIDSYKPTKNISTTIFIVKMMYGSEERISVLTLNMVRLKKTLIYYAYYKNYLNPKTIEQVRAKNDLFGYKLLEINN